MPFIMDPLPMGDHDLTESVVTWKAEVVDAKPPALRLIASLQSSPRQTTAQSRGVTATSLALSMDPMAALTLYEELGDRIRDMGWQQYVSGGRPI